MATNSKNFRIGKSIEEVMLQRSIDADILPPVHTSQQLQRTLSRANKSRKKSTSSISRMSRSSASPLDGLRHSGSAGKIPPPTSGSGSNPTYDNFVMESLMEHCRSLQARVQVSSRHCTCMASLLFFSEQLFLMKIIYLVVFLFHLSYVFLVVVICVTRKWLNFRILKRS